MSSEITVPLSNQGLLALQRDADDISRQVTDAYFTMHPECNRGDPDKIRAMCKADFDHHLKFLLSAMVTATPEMFIEYALWLKDVLQSRQLQVQHAIDAFSLMRKFMKQRLDKDDQSVVSQTIEAGLEALKSQRTEVAYYQQDANEIMSLSPDYTESLISGNRKQAESIIKASIESGTPLIDIEVGIVQPAMYEIGRLWQKNKITVAQEHLATAISQNAIARAFSSAEFSDSVDRSVVCACIEGNHHSLGLRMISDAYELSGWDVSFLGADTPNSSIIAQADAKKPDVLALSVSLPYQILTLQQLIEHLRSEMGAQMPSIVVGGLAFNNHQSLGSRISIDNWYIDARSVMDDIKQ